MSNDENAIYDRQGFGHQLTVTPPVALLVVDFVVGFTDEAHFGGGNINAALSRTRALLEHARSHEWAIAHSRIVFADDGSDANGFSDKVPALLGLTETAELSQIVADVAPFEGELVVRKNLPSAFAGTNLQAWLTRHGVRTVVVAGCTTSGCIRASVIDAMNYGFIPIVIRDCVGDRALGPHEANLFDMQQKYAQLLDLDDLVSDRATPR